MNIVFAINNGYTKPVCVTITSILRHNGNANFYILHKDIEPDNMRKICQTVKFYKGSTVEFIKVDESKFTDLTLNIDYISIETYFRYIIADVLPNIDKCLYLDADIIVQGTLKKLYRTDLGDNYLGGVKDACIDATAYKPEIGFSSSDLYVNAGVLLLNLKKWRADNLSQKFLQNTKELNGKIKYQDQDVINMTCKGKICRLPHKYNYTTKDLKDNKYLAFLKNIIHYTGCHKPWLADSKHKQKYIWQKYEKIWQKNMSRKIKVALLIDEFFGGAGTAYGGYGFLARKYIAKYIPNEDISIDVLLGKGKRRYWYTKYHVDEVDLYRLPKRNFMAKLFMWWKNYDIYLSIELTNDYVLLHEPSKNKKLILWIQDPRPKYEWDEITTMKLMPEHNYYNQRVYDTVHKMYEENRVRFITQGYFLNQKAIDLYNLKSDVRIQYMPNPIKIDDNFDVRNYQKKNMIIFLGRLEDVKRGWIFCEIAKKLPEYEFAILGKTNTSKDKTKDFWKKYAEIPNLHFMGHVDGKLKEQYLKDAKILVNTSIHEALPISFLEALSYGCCIVSNRNPEKLTEKFGIWIGNVLGDGVDKIDLYIKAIKNLITNDEKRKKKGIQGREYIRSTHNIPRFVKDLRNVIYEEMYNVKS